MTPAAHPSPQLQARQVSYAPRLFRSIKPKKHELLETSANLLHDVSFEIFPGDRIALIGASGAGKTTLLRLLNRLSEPTRGQLFWHGQPYSAMPTVQLRQQVVMVMQESKLLDMTVQDALAYPLKLRGISQQAISERVSHWMERLRIPSDWRDRTEQQLSVGQRQLVAIARALVTEPPFLLCDEPTAALDVGRIQQILQVFTELSESQQTTIVMVNHQIDLAQQLATRVFHLQNGTLVLDQPSFRVDWAELKNHLQHIEEAQVAEWD